MENEKSWDIESKIQVGIARASLYQKAIMMPDVRKFEEIFATHTVIPELGSYKSKAAHTWKVLELLPDGKSRPNSGIAELSSFCPCDLAQSVHTERGWKYFDITATPQTIKTIFDNMLLVDQYVINIGISERDDGTALVFANYNMISGSRWLAIIDSSTIPGQSEGELFAEGLKRAGYIKPT